MRRGSHRRLTSSTPRSSTPRSRPSPCTWAAAMVYEGRLSLRALVRALEARLHLLPRYRQKVVFPPFASRIPPGRTIPTSTSAITWPRSRCPRRATIGCSRRSGGRAFAGMLDRDHPLWKLIVVHGPRRRQYRGDLEGAPRHDRRGLRRGSHHGAPRPQAGRGAARSRRPRPGSPGPSRPAHAAAGRGQGPAHRGGPDRSPTTPSACSGRPSSRRGSGSSRGAVSASAPNLLRPAPRVPFNGPIAAGAAFRLGGVPVRRVPRA